jgi:hypothetical protein
MLKVGKYVVLILAILISFCSLSFAAISGDANDNGKLDLADAIIILQTLVGLRPTESFDVTGLWAGTVTLNWGDGSSTNNTPMVLSLVQSGTSVSGILANADGNLNITGNISGNVFNMIATLPCSSGSTTLTLTHTVSGSGMTATSGAGGACPSGANVSVTGYAGSLTKTSSPQVSTFKTIAIDGSFTDWDSLGVLFNSQIGNFKLAHDKSKIYVFFDMGNAISNGTYYQVSLFKGTNDGYDLRIINNTALINRYVGDFSTGFIANGSIAVGANKIEASFSMSDLGISNASTIWIRPHTFNTTQTNMGNFTQVILW